VNAALFTYLLRLGDDNMILGQRLGELVSRMPELEEDIAVANLSLDHLGQARSLYSYAGEVEGAGRDEDALAMLRGGREYVNAVLVEQPNGDFATTMVRQFFFDVYQTLLWADLANDDDESVAGIASRAAKEAAYHHEFSSGWVTRLGDGTEQSHRRTQDAADNLWKFTSELSDSYHDQWNRRVAEVFAGATLTLPDDPYQRSGGRDGYHTEHLGFLLAEMQWMDRAYPGQQW